MMEIITLLTVETIITWIYLKDQKALMKILLIVEKKKKNLTELNKGMLDGLKELKQSMSDGFKDLGKK